MLPLDQFLAFINQNKLFNPSDRILLAVSGGRDSVLLAHLFNAANFSFGMAHCNFGLRGQESDSDQAFVKDLADKLGVPFYGTRFDTEKFAKANSISTQMAARELRYNWFEQLRGEYSYHYVAIAHHLNDTAETILLNLVRGTGISGMHGILPKRGNIIRPMLFLTANEIETIIRENNICYREDSSNTSPKYVRNKIRLEVIPKLKEINPKLEDTFEQNSIRFSQLEEFLHLQVEKLRAEIFKPSGSGSVSISLEKLKELQPRKLLIYELFKNYGFSDAVLSDLVSSWDGQPGKTFESASHLLILDRGELLLIKKDKEQVDEVVFIDEDEAALRVPEFTLIYQRKCVEKVKIGANINTAFIDADLLQFPLKLRQWEKGDYFFPFGMKGRKKLSDYFINLKIPLSDKKKIKILENGNGDVIWVVGYRSDDRYKITGQTKKVYIFEKHKPR